MCVWILNGKARRKTRKTLFVCVSFSGSVVGLSKNSCVRSKFCVELSLASSQATFSMITHTLLPEARPQSPIAIIYMTLS